MVVGGAPLAPEPRAALLAASCLADHFDTESLAAALGSEPVTTFRLLAALRERLDKWQEKEGDLIADPAVLAKLTAEHEAMVAEHYPPGDIKPRDTSLMHWRYAEYMQPGRGAKA